MFAISKLGLAAAALYLASSVAVAQAPQTRPPTRERVYTTAPIGLAPPKDFSAASLRSAQGDFVKWAKETRASLGTYESDADFAARLEAWRAEIAAKKNQPPSFSPTRIGTPLPDVEGYFMLVGPDPNEVLAQGSIFHATWTGADGTTLLKLSSIEGACAAQPKAAAAPYTPDLFVYLGARWMPAWSEVSTALRADFAAPSIPFGADPAYTLLPTGRSFERHYPNRALEREKNGDATLACAIQDDGRLACAPILESPTGWGFADSALKIAADFQLAPTLRDGTPSTGKCIVMPIGFRLSP